MDQCSGQLCFPHMHFTLAALPGIFGNPLEYFILYFFIFFNPCDRVHHPWLIIYLTISPHSSPPFSCLSHMLCRQRNRCSLVLHPSCEHTDCQATSPCKCTCLLHCHSVNTGLDQLHNYASSTHGSPAVMPTESQVKKTKSQGVFSGNFIKLTAEGESR